MPSMNSNIGDVGRGFAAFLSPPPEGVVRFTVGQPDFRTPQPVVDAAKAALDAGTVASFYPVHAIGDAQSCLTASDDNALHFQVSVLPQTSY